MIGLGLGLVRQAVRNASGQAWTPAQLFSSGQQGAWYEPKPEYLYQDAAGTVPVTADGDPVGYMVDLSGNGNHATQSTSAARPIYRTDGTLHWLAFDGVDDGLKASQAIDKPALSYYAAIKVLETSNQPKCIIDSFESESKEWARLGFDIDAYASSLDNNGVKTVLPFNNQPNVNDKVRFLLTHDTQSGLMNNYINGSLDSSITLASKDLIEGREPEAIGINSGINGENIKMTVYGIIFMDKVLSSAEISSSEQYFAQKSGVTL